MPMLPLRGLGSLGVTPDTQGQALPIGAWDDARNVRFSGISIEKMLEPELAIAWDSATLGVPKRMQGWTDGLSTYFAVAARLGGADYLYFWRASSGETGTWVQAGGPYPAGNWQSFAWGDTCVFNNGETAPQIFNPNTALFTDLPGWGIISTADDLTEGSAPSYNTKARCKVLLPYKSFLVALGVTESGLFRPNTTWWSNSTPLVGYNTGVNGTGGPPDWDYESPGSLSGKAEVGAGEGRLQWGELLNEQLILYTDSSATAMILAGGGDVMQFRRLFNKGCAGLYLAAEFNNQHFVVARDQVYVHDGNTVRMIAKDRVEEEFFRRAGKGGRYGSGTVDFTTMQIVKNPDRKELTILLDEERTELVPSVACGPYSCSALDDYMAELLGQLGEAGQYSGVWGRTLFQYDLADTNQVDQLYGPILNGGSAYSGDRGGSWWCQKMGVGNALNAANREGRQPTFCSIPSDARPLDFFDINVYGTSVMYCRSPDLHKFVDSGVFFMVLSGYGQDSYSGIAGCGPVYLHPTTGDYTLTSYHNGAVTTRPAWGLAWNQLQGGVQFQWKWKTDGDRVRITVVDDMFKSENELGETRWVVIACRVSRTPESVTAQFWGTGGYAGSVTTTTSSDGTNLSANNDWVMDPDLDATYPERYAYIGSWPYAGHNNGTGFDILYGAATKGSISDDAILDIVAALSRNYEDYELPATCTNINDGRKTATINARAGLVYNYEDDNYTWMDASVDTGTALKDVIGMHYAFDPGWVVRWSDLQTDGTLWSALQTGGTNWDDFYYHGEEKNLYWFTDDGIYKADQVVKTDGVKQYFAFRDDIDLDDVVQAWTSHNYKYSNQAYFHIEQPRKLAENLPNPFTFNIGAKNNLMDDPLWREEVIVNLNQTANAGNHKADYRATGRYFSMRLEFDTTGEFRLSGMDMHAEEAHGR